MYRENIIGEKGIENLSKCIAQLPKTLINLTLSLRFFIFNLKTIFI